MDITTLCLLVALALAYVAGGCFSLYYLSSRYDAEDFDDTFGMILTCYLLWFFMLPMMMGENRKARDAGDDRKP